MAKSEIVCGLDMGSSRVVCVIGTPDPEGQGMRILGGAAVPCRGLKGGVVLNVHEAARAIRAAVEKAEEQAHQMVHGVYLGIRGSHLQSFNNKGAYNIARTDKEITEDDVRAVIEIAKAVQISQDREILHVIPQSYGLDKTRGVPNPVGMEGSLLEVDVHIVTASSSHLNNLTRAVAEAGFEVIEPVYSVLALGELLVSPEERDLGSLLMDFGGHTVSLGIYSEGAIRFSLELAIGADFITRDLAIGLRTNMATAEKLKIEHGAAHPSLFSADGEAEIVFKGVDGRSEQRCKPSSIMNIILPRIEQIFSVIGEEVQKSNLAELIVPGGAILTGGGATLRGIPQAAEQILNMPARQGLPHPDLVHASDGFMTPAFSTALALVCYPAAKGFTLSGIGPSRADSRWLRRAKKWFEDLF